MFPAVFRRKDAKRPAVRSNAKHGNEGKRPAVRSHVKDGNEDWWAGQPLSASPGFVVWYRGGEGAENHEAESVIAEGFNTAFDPGFRPMAD